MGYPHKKPPLIKGISKIIFELNIFQVTCVGKFTHYGLGGWDFIPESATDWHPGLGVMEIPLKICVPENYLNKD